MRKIIKGGRITQGILLWKISLNPYIENIFYVYFILFQGIIADAEKIPIEDQALFYGGNPLSDDDKISNCLTDGATVDVCCRLKGGKKKKKK